MRESGTREAVSNVQGEPTRGFLGFRVPLVHAKDLPAVAHAYYEDFVRWPVRHTIRADTNSKRFVLL
jgi:hypothetical protein